MQEHLPFFCHISQLGLCRTIGNAVIKLETKAQTNCYVMPTIGPNSKMGCQSACVNRRPQGVPDWKWPETNTAIWDPIQFWNWPMDLELSENPKLSPEQARSQSQMGCQKTSSCVPKTRHGNSINNRNFNHILLFFFRFAAKLTRNIKKSNAKTTLGTISLPLSLQHLVFLADQKGANPDRIDDRGVGWLCGYKGPLQDRWQRGLLSGWKFQRRKNAWIPSENKKTI